MRLLPFSFGYENEITVLFLWYLSNSQVLLLNYKIIVSKYKIKEMKGKTGANSWRYYESV